MSTLTLILLIIALIVVILLIAAALMKDEYSIERETIINKPKQEVFNYIRLLKNQVNYNKWTMIDPNAKREFRGTDGVAGFVFAWDSSNKQVGKGEQEIKKISEGERIDFALRFIKPFEGNANASIITESAFGNQTRVKWIFNGIRNYPMKIMHLVLNLKKILGRDLQTSLDNLKAVLEK